MSFGDAATVDADCEKQDWKVTSGTLNVGPDFTTSITINFLYVWPIPSASGIGGSGYGVTGDKITCYRRGESYRPLPDDQIEADGETYLITKVNSRLNADELTLGYAVYDCTVTKKTNA